MNQTQLHSWNQMIELIRKYEEGKLPYHYLVDGLEAAMDDADFKDQILVKTWYEFWTPLEELDEETSHEIEDVSPAQIFQQLEKFRDFLAEQLKLESHAPAHAPHKPVHARHVHR
jgi:hypothetical protein